MAGEWPLVALGPRCRKIGSGATPRGGKEAYLEAGPFALIRSQNVLDFRFAHDGLAYIDQRQADALSGVEVGPQDILLNITGDSVARVCLVEPTVLPARVNQHVAIVRADPKEFDQRFLFYSLVAPQMKRKLLALASAGATRNALTKGDIERLEIPQPSMPEQKAIADILGALDRKIDLNRRMASTLEAMARTLFRSWFVDFEPVRAKADGRPTGLADEFNSLFPAGYSDEGLPLGWVAAKFRSVISNVISRTSPSQITAELPYVPIDAIGAKSLTGIQPKDGSEAQSSLVKFERDDILFGAMRPYFHKVALAPSHGTTRSTVFVLRFIRPEDLWYCLLLASEKSTIDFATSGASGSTIPYAVWDGGLAEMECALPPPSLRAAFGTVVQPLLRNAQHQQEQVRTLSDLRDALLPRLVSGELRVGDVRQAIEAA